MKLIIFFFLYQSYIKLDQTKAYVHVYNPQTQSLDKMECQKNCSMCILDHINDYKTTWCIMCEKKYFLTAEHNCQSCIENCEHCLGPVIKDCQAVTHGFYYNSAQDEIQSCNTPGVSVCDDNRQPIKCLHGFYMDPKEKQCLECKIQGCSKCTFVNEQPICTQCSKEGFYLTEGACKKCQSQCQLCENETGKCLLCNEGYYRDPNTHQCNKLLLENCKQQTSGGQCETCMANAYSFNDQCNLCAKEIEHCVVCMQLNSQLKCKFCETGYYLDQASKCQKNPQNCKEFDSKIQKCISCHQEFYLHQNQCLKCEIDDCQICESKQKCFQCKYGKFFDAKQQKCLDCPQDCLHCAKENKCSVCSVRKFYQPSYQISEKDEEFSFSNNPLGSILGAFFGNSMFKDMKVHSFKQEQHGTCVTKCPSQQLEKNKITILTTRKCTMIQEKNIEDLTPAEKANEQKIKTINEIFYDVKQAYEQYEQKNTQLQNSLNSDQYKRETNDLSCYYKGSVKRSVMNDIFPYKICRCIEGYYGQNCTFTAEYLKSYNLTLHNLISNVQISVMQYNDVDLQVVLMILNEFVWFELDDDILTQFYLLLTVIEKKFSQIVQFIYFYFAIDNLIQKYLQKILYVSEIKAEQGDSIDEDLILKQENNQNYLNQLTQFMINCFIKTKFGMALDGQQKLMFNMSMLSYVSMEEVNIKEFSGQQIVFTLTQNHSNSKVRNISKIKLNFKNPQAIDELWHLKIISLNQEIFYFYLKDFKNLRLVSDLILLKITKGQNNVEEIPLSQANLESIEIEMFLKADSGDGHYKCGIYDQFDFDFKYDNDSDNQEISKNRRVDYTNCRFDSQAVAEMYNAAIGVFY